MASMNARTIHTVLRGTSITLAVLVLTQVVLAGSFIGGHYPMLRLHSMVGAALVILGLLQAVVVLLPGRRGRPRFVLTAGLMLPVALAVQAALGVFRILELHVPVGVFMVIGIFRLADWAWRTPLPGRSGTALQEERLDDGERTGVVV